MYFLRTLDAVRDLLLLAHDIRSCHNVGSLLRTAEGLGVTKVYLTGYSPYPTQITDERLPHIHQKLTRQIQKTALGAEVSQPWEHYEDITDLIKQLRNQGYVIVALEQTPQSIELAQYKCTSKIALLIGREVEGIATDLLAHVDDTVVIPMYGSKESFNVVQATAMALYQFRFH